MSERIDWGRVLGGDPDPWRPDWAERAAEHRANRAAFEAAIEADPEWKAARKRQAEVAEHVRGRGNWVGAAVGCPEHQAEQRAADDGRHVVIEKVDHTCWREDMRLQARLQDQVRIRQAEADGGIRVGKFYQDRPVDQVAAEMDAVGRERQLTVGVAFRMGPG